MQKTRKNADCWHREWQGGGSHTAKAKKTENYRAIGRGTSSGRVMVGLFEKWSLQGSVPTFSVQCSILLVVVVKQNLSRCG